jgi:hypothetical protein
MTVDKPTPTWPGDPEARVPRERRLSAPGSTDDVPTSLPSVLKKKVVALSEAEKEKERVRVAGGLLGKAPRAQNGIARVTYH